MLFIENTGFSVNEDSASSHLGKETGYWIFPLKGDKPFKIAGEALLPRLSLTLEKLGIKVSEDVLTKALRTHSTKELQLVAEKSAKDLAFLQRGGADRPSRRGREGRLWSRRSGSLRFFGERQERH